MSGRRAQPLGAQSLPVANGSFVLSKDKHWGYGPTSPVMPKVAGGGWQVD